MKYRIFDQKAKLADYLDEFRQLPLSFESLCGLPQHVKQAFVTDHDIDLRSDCLNFFFRYQIFPSAILDFFGEWQLSDREMQVGDIIVQQAKIPPGPVSVKVICAVRVISVVREMNKISFSYGTLKGHPEVGVNEFSFFRSDGKIFARVQTTAQPGSVFSRILAPIFTKPYVHYCNQQALATLKQGFLQAVDCL